MLSPLLAVGDPLTQVWHWELVFASYLIACLGSATSLILFKYRKTPSNHSSKRLSPKRRRLNLILLIAASVSLGAIGVWSMHAVGMSAVDVIGPTGAALPMAFDEGILIASLIVVILIFTIGFWISSGASSLIKQLCSGVLGGGAVATMHYIGMMGIKIEAELDWNPGFVALSVVLGVVVTNVALMIFFRLSHLWSKNNWIMAGTAMIMGIAVCSVHYTGTYAAIWREKAANSVNLSGYSPQSQMLAVTIALSISSCVILISLLVYRHQMQKRAMLLKREEEKALGQQLTLAVLAVNTDGMILMTAAHTLPSVVLDHQFDQEFDQYSPDFIRFFRAAMDWPSLDTRLLQVKRLYKAGEIKSHHLQRFESFVRGVHQLSHQLCLSIEQMGILHWVPTYHQLTLIIHPYTVSEKQLNTRRLMHMSVFGSSTELTWSFQSPHLLFGWLSKYLALGKSASHAHGSSAGARRAHGSQTDGSRSAHPLQLEGSLNSNSRSIRLHSGSHTDQSALSDLLSTSDSTASNTESMANCRDWLHDTLTFPSLITFDLQREQIDKYHQFLRYIAIQLHIPNDAIPSIVNEWSTTLGRWMKSLVQLKRLIHPQYRSHWMNIPLDPIVKMEIEYQLEVHCNANGVKDRDGMDPVLNRPKRFGKKRISSRNGHTESASDLEENDNPRDASADGHDADTDLASPSSISPAAPLLGPAAALSSNSELDLGLNDSLHTNHTYHLGLYYIQVSSGSQRRLKVLLPASGPYSNIPVVKLHASNGLNSDLASIREEIRRIQTIIKSNRVELMDLPAGKLKSTLMHQRAKAMLQRKSAGLKDRETVVDGQSNVNAESSGNELLNSLSMSRRNRFAGTDAASIGGAQLQPLRNSSFGTAVETGSITHLPAAKTDELPLGFFQSCAALSDLLGTDRDLTLGNLKDCEWISFSPNYHVLMFKLVKLGSQWPTDYSNEKCLFAPLPVFEVLHAKQFQMDTALVGGTVGKGVGAGKVKPLGVPRWTRQPLKDHSAQVNPSTLQGSFVAHKYGNNDEADTGNVAAAAAAELNSMKSRESEIDENDSDIAERSDDEELILRKSCRNAAASKYRLPNEVNIAVNSDSDAPESAIVSPAARPPAVPVTSSPTVQGEPKVELVIEQ